MAWRIHDQVVRVVTDNRIPNIVTGSIWLAGRNDPPQLEAKQPAEATTDCDRVLEQKLRIDSLKEQVRALSDGHMLSGENENVPLDIQEQFWRHVLEFEQDSFPSLPVREILAKDGIHPVPPDQLRDDEIGTHLERLAESMARRGLLLCQTDHLSDRDLYTLLVERVIDEKADVFPVGSGWFTHLFVSDLGAPDGEDGVQVYLRYYADPEVRERWANEFPDEPMPPHEELPHDRDRWLPGLPSR